MGVSTTSSRLDNILSYSIQPSSRYGETTSSRSKRLKYKAKRLAILKTINCNSCCLHRWLCSCRLRSVKLSKRKVKAKSSSNEWISSKKWKRSLIIYSRRRPNRTTIRQRLVNASSRLTRSSRILLTMISVTGKSCRRTSSSQWWSTGIFTS